MLAFASGEAAAATGAVPLPRPKPALATHRPPVPLPLPRPVVAPPLADIGAQAARKAHIRNAGPDLARGRVPLPRPKPTVATISPLSQDGANGMTDEAVRTDRRGRVVVSLTDIGGERDPTTASDLAPSLEGSWSQHDVAVARLRCAIVLATSNIVAALKDPIGGPQGLRHRRAHRGLGLRRG